MTEQIRFNFQRRDKFERWKFLLNGHNLCNDSNTQFVIERE